MHGRMSRRDGEWNDRRDILGVGWPTPSAPLLERLEPRLQQIVRIRFFEQRTQSEIAEELGISQVHVSRLLRRALEEMRAFAGEELQTAPHA